MASASGCMPMFRSPDAQKTGKSLPARIARARPAVSSSCVSVPASKNFSISASSASATISMSASRAALGGRRPSRRARRLRSSCRIRRRRTCSAFIDDQIDDAVEVLLLADGQLHRHARCARASCASTRARGRGSRARGRAGCSTMSRGSLSSSAASQAFSVETCTPETASTTTSAASATRSAARRRSRSCPCRACRSG